MHPDLQDYYPSDQVELVPMLSNIQSNLRKRKLFTFLFLSASAKDCAPVIPILFPLRVSEMSVCLGGKKLTK